MNRNTKSLALIFIACALCVVLAGCRLVTVVPLNSDNKAQFYYEDSSFDPAKYAADEWPKIAQFAKENANSVTEVLALYATDKDACGKKYGRRSAEEGATWNYCVTGKGKVQKVNLESKNGLLEVDLQPYDGAIDCFVQVGPVIKGTAVRDAMPFILFQDFKNQLTFGDVAKAINKYSCENIAAKLPLDTLVNQTVEFVGIFSQSDKIMIVPTEISVSKG